MMELARRLEEHAKGMVVPGTMFEEFGFNYVGPIDGHDLDSLVPTLQNMRELRGPQFLHVVTKKGQGYKLAEADPVLYHGPGKFDPGEGIRSRRLRRPSSPTRRCSPTGSATWRAPTSAWSRSRRRCARARAWSSSSRRFPRRYFDVGIAEQHAVTFAAGLACEGLRPVVAIYSTFLQRGYDQLIHDVALQNLPVIFALDRAGLVGADGATHAGNLRLRLPALHSEHGRARALGRRRVPRRCSAPRFATTARARCATRAARAPASTPAAGLDALPFGRGEVRRQGRGVAILAFGTMLAPSLKAGEAIDATVANMRWVKPVDAATGRANWRARTARWSRSRSTR